jgi:hypothetical protein
MRWVARSSTTIDHVADAVAGRQVVNRTTERNWLLMDMAILAGEE